MAAMETFVAKYAAKIRGMLCCFDRVLFRGYLPLRQAQNLRVGLIAQ